MSDCRFLDVGLCSMAFLPLVWNLRLDMPSVPQWLLSIGSWGRPRKVDRKRVIIGWIRYVGYEVGISDPFASF